MKNRIPGTLFSQIGVDEFLSDSNNKPSVVKIIEKINKIEINSIIFLNLMVKKVIHYLY